MGAWAISVSPKLPGFSRQTRQLYVGIIYYEGLTHTTMEAEKASVLPSPACWSLRQAGGGSDRSESIKVNGVHPSLKDRHAEHLSRRS